MFKTNIPPLFDIDDKSSWKTYLDDEGYVVLKNILSENEIKEAFGLFLKDMKHVSPTFNIENTETFDIKYTPMMFAKGMAVFNGFGNCDFIWYLRTNPHIRKIYELLYEEKELTVSMDGFSMFVSSEQKPGQWLHIDQNPKSSIYSIQGSYNFLPVTENSSGFVVIPKSHKTFLPDVSTKSDWIIYDKYKTGFEQLEEETVKLIIPENCFVLWNSKTLHANTGIVKPPRAKKILRFDRLTCWITYLPRSLSTQTNRQLRIQAYKDNQTTSHWSNKCELKSYPYGFGPTYVSRGFNTIISKRGPEDSIPLDRLLLI